MVVLRLVAIACVAGCYSPELGNCVTACETEADCSPGQTCGGDHLCAAPALAGSCAAQSVDAAVAVDAAPPADAVAIDAAPLDVMLRVRIADVGSVVVDGIGSCRSGPPQGGDCTFAASIETIYKLHAIPGLDREFEKWDSIACGGQGPTCTLLLTAPLTEVRAKFRRD